MLLKRALQQKKARPGWMAGRGHVHATTDAAYGTVGERPRIRPKMAEITNSMIATKKIILAISTANPAMPPNPSTAAINATIKKVKAQPSMALLLSLRVSRRQRPIKRKCSEFRRGEQFRVSRIDPA